MQEVSFKEDKIKTSDGKDVAIEMDQLETSDPVKKLSSPKEVAAEKTNVPPLMADVTIDIPDSPRGEPVDSSKSLVVQDNENAAAVSAPERIELSNGNGESPSNGLDEEKDSVNVIDDPVEGLEVGKDRVSIVEIKDHIISVETPIKDERESDPILDRKPNLDHSIDVYDSEQVNAVGAASSINDTPLESSTTIDIPDSGEVDELHEVISDPSQVDGDILQKSEDVEIISDPSQFDGDIVPKSDDVEIISDPSLVDGGIVPKSDDVEVISEPSQFDGDIVPKSDDVEVISGHSQINGDIFQKSNDKDNDTTLISESGKVDESYEKSKDSQIDISEEIISKKEDSTESNGSHGETEYVGDDAVSENLLHVTEEPPMQNSEGSPSFSAAGESSASVLDMHEMKNTENVNTNESMGDKRSESDESFENAESIVDINQLGKENIEENLENVASINGEQSIISDISQTNMEDKSDSDLRADVYDDADVTERQNIPTGSVLPEDNDFRDEENDANGASQEILDSPDATVDAAMAEANADEGLGIQLRESAELLKSDRKDSEGKLEESLQKEAQLEKQKDDMPSRRHLEPNRNKSMDLEDQDMFLPKPLLDDDELPWFMYKKRIENEKEESPVESEEEESDDDKYVPQSTEDLPDVYEAMDSFDKDDIELNKKTSPPSVLDSSQQQLYNKEVENLKQGLAEEDIKIYLDEFEEEVKKEILMIGNISLEDVQDEERRLREEHISFQQEQAKLQRTRQQEIMLAMERAKKYVMRKYKEKNRELRMREQHLMQKDRSYKDEIHRAFRRSESQLRKALKRRKAEVKTMFGDLSFADGQYGGSKGRRWKIDWNRAPQPVQIRLKCLRGVKDKLPESRYVLMVSLYNRLGGNVMKWSKLRGQQWGGATLPMHHQGEFFNTELKIDQSVFTVCPSRPDIRPGMALVFELFILRGSVTPTDKVVGWGCFPICDAEFNVIEGKYKTPMLRGDMDPGIDKFEVVEKLMAEDLENWLCNFYFEIIKLPRYMAGQKEYEVELQFTSGLIGAPNRTITGEENIDGEKPIFGSRSDIQSSLSQKDNISHTESFHSESIASLNVEEDDSGSIKKPNALAVEVTEGRNSASSNHKLSKNSTIQMFRAENLSVDLRKLKVEASAITEEISRPMTSMDASRKLVEERGLQLSDYGSDASDYDADDVYALKKDVGFKPVKGEPGMFYKIHYNNPADVYARRIYTMMPKTPLLSKMNVKKKMTHMEVLNTHSFAVKTPWSNKGHIEHKSSKKIQYIGRMLLSELGISQVKSRPFWAMILMILITFWIRLYLHYVGQWVALLAFYIPINKFEILPYTVQLNYQNTLLRAREEIALVVIGPFTNILLFAIMVVVSLFIQILFDRFPNLFSQFIMAFGIHSFLDPIWILIVDSALERFRNRGGDYPIGDAFKLYWHFNRFFRNDNVTLFVSIALTTVLYFVTMFCAIAILYMYFLSIHNNGRLMDVYWRLHGREEQFFVPYDLEISNEELNYISRKAEQWRGEEGERRKTAVYDYVWEEEEMVDEDWVNPKASRGKKTGAKEITSHVSIHTLHLDGLRELYRHFLKLPDGAIVEVFGEMNIPGIDESVKQALMKRTTFQAMTGDGLRQRSATSASRTSTLKGNLKVSTVDILGLPDGATNV